MSVKQVAHKPGRLGHRKGGDVPSRESDAEAPGSTPGSNPDVKDDLKSLPLPEVEKRLESSPDGLTQVEAQKRLTQYGPSRRESLSW